MKRTKHNDGKQSRKDVCTLHDMFDQAKHHMLAHKEAISTFVRNPYDYLLLLLLLLLRVGGADPEMYFRGGSYQPPNLGIVPSTLNPL